ncbi:MAG: S-layer homology domain-containing protein [Clostridiales Family XIII bacterium]|nr:S-layer homology domain-containing protein [Clostridiales Family XIII bacterium]
MMRKLTAIVMTVAMITAMFSLTAAAADAAGEKVTVNAVSEKNIVISSDAAGSEELPDADDPELKFQVWKDEANLLVEDIMYLEDYVQLTYKGTEYSLFSYWDDISLEKASTETDVLEEYLGGLIYIAQNQGTVKFTLTLEGKTASIDVIVKSFEEADGLTATFDHKLDENAYSWLLQYDPSVGEGKSALSWVSHEVKELDDPNKIKLIFNDFMDLDRYTYIWRIVEFNTVYLVDNVEKGSISFSEDANRTVTVSGNVDLDEQIACLAFEPEGMGGNGFNMNLIFDANKININDEHAGGGSYFLKFPFEYEEELYACAEMLDLRGFNFAIDLTGKIDKYRSLKIDWDSAYDQGNYAMIAAGQQLETVINRAENGEKIYFLRDGIYDAYESFDISSYLTSQGVEYCIESSVNTDNDSEIKIGSEFNGKLYLDSSETVFAPKSYMQAYISACFDKNDNELIRAVALDGDKSIAGEIILTDVKNSSNVIRIPVSFRTTDSIAFYLPDTTGEYSVRLAINEPVVAAPEAPTASKAAGSYSGSQSVSLSTATAGAKIYYTTDGNTPIVNNQSQLYTSAITVNKNMTIKAIAEKDGAVSPVSSFIYTISASVSTGGGGFGGVSASNQPQVVKNVGGAVTASSDGKSVTITPDSGYHVKDVIVNGQSVGAVTSYTFEKAQTSNKIEVVFEKTEATTSAAISGAAITEGEAPLGFTDIEAGSWYQEAVAFVLEKGIAQGTSDTKFSPQGLVTRAQFITMLCRAYGIEERTGDNFADAGSTWYSGYLAAAKQLGISAGIGDNLFAPEQEVTREQMMVLLYNYFKSVTPEINVPENATLPYADADGISAWAVDGVTYGTLEQWVKGKDGNRFDPKGVATRAELAQIFYNILSVAE